MSAHYDIFVTNAFPEETKYIHDLTAKLRRLGVEMKYNDPAKQQDKSWRDTIFENLENCDTGLIIITDKYFDSSFTSDDVCHLLDYRMVSGDQKLLPVLFNVSEVKLQRRYPDLNDRLQFIDADRMDIKDIVINLAKMLIMLYHSDWSGWHMSDSMSNQ